MAITIELDEALSRQLLDLAALLQVDPAELAKAAVRDLLRRPDDDIERVIRRVLNRNWELYRRLGSPSSEI